MKSPPRQFTDYEARQKVEEFIQGKDQQTQRELSAKEAEAELAHRTQAQRNGIKVERSN